MHIMSTNLAKTLVWKQENDVKLWRHKQRTPNANDHHMTLNQTPPWKFSAYATGDVTCIEREEIIDQASPRERPPLDQALYSVYVYFSKHTIALTLRNSSGTPGIGSRTPVRESPPSVEALYYDAICVGEAFAVHILGKECKLLYPESMLADCSFANILQHIIAAWTSC